MRAMGARRLGPATVAVLIATGMLAVAAAPSAHAATCATSWKKAVSGSWSAAANWTHGVPTATSATCITLPGTYTVTAATSGQHVGSLTLGGTSGTATLVLVGSCTNDAPVLVLASGGTVGAHGVFEMNPTACNTDLAGGGRITNAGTIVLTGKYRVAFYSNVTNNGHLSLRGAGDVVGSWTNNGTVGIAKEASYQFEGTGFTNHGDITAAGDGALYPLQTTFVEAEGRLIGTSPVVVDDTTVRYAGTGSGTITVVGYDTTVTGNISAGQTLALAAGCSSVYTSYATAASSTQLTNRGTIVLESGCERRSDFFANPLVNLGTIRATHSGTSGVVQLEGSVVNDGVVSINSGVAVVETHDFTNAADGTLAFGIAGATTFGQLAEDSAAFTLDGTLKISTASTYWPASGLTFPVIARGDRSGTFATVTGATRTGHAVGYAVAYTSGGANLTTS